MKVNRSQLVELIINGVSGGNTGTKFYFPDVPYLRGVFTEGIESFTNADQSVSTTGNNVATGAQAAKAFITLVDDSANEVCQNIPFADLHRIQNSSTDPFVRVPYSLCDKKLDFSKCYITLGSALSNTANVSFIFNVYYHK